MGGGPHFNFIYLSSLLQFFTNFLGPYIRFVMSKLKQNKTKSLAQVRYAFPFSSRLNGMFHFRKELRQGTILKIRIVSSETPDTGSPDSNHCLRHRLSLHWLVRSRLVRSLPDRPCCEYPCDDVAYGLRAVGYPASAGSRSRACQSRS